MTSPSRAKSLQGREAGHYDVPFVGTNANGDRMEVTVTGDMDPGYGSTCDDCCQCAALQDRTFAEVFTHQRLLWGETHERLVANAGLTFDLGS